MESTLFLLVMCFVILSALMTGYNVLIMKTEEDDTKDQKERVKSFVIKSLIIVMALFVIYEAIGLLSKYYPF